MNEEDMIPPSVMREWCTDPAYVEAVNRGSDQLLERPLDVEALLVGIRFLHNFVESQEGKVAVQRAVFEGFVQLVPGGGHDSNIYVIPRFLWRDDFYDQSGHGRAGKRPRPTRTS